MNDQRVPTAKSTPAEDSLPFIDSAVLVRQHKICRDAIAWYIYWRIDSFRRHNRECFESPKELMRPLGIGWSTMQRAVERGCKAGLFARDGKSRSRLGRSWRLVLDPDSLFNEIGKNVEAGPDDRGCRSSSDEGPQSGRRRTARQQAGTHPKLNDYDVRHRVSAHPASGETVTQHRVSAHPGLGDSSSEVIERSRTEGSVCSEPESTHMSSDSSENGQRKDTGRASVDVSSATRAANPSADISDSPATILDGSIEGSAEGSAEGSSAGSCAGSAVCADVCSSDGSAVCSVGAAPLVRPAAQPPAIPDDLIRKALNVYRRAALAALSAHGCRPSLWSAGGRDFDELSRVAAGMPKEEARGLAAAIGRLAPSWCAEAVSKAASIGEDHRNALATSVFCRWLAGVSQKEKLACEATQRTSRSATQTAALKEAMKRDTIGESMKNYFSVGFNPKVIFDVCRNWGVVLTAQYLASKMSKEEAVGLIEASLTGQTSIDLADAFSATVKFEAETAGMLLSDWRVNLAANVDKAGKLPAYPVKGHEKEWCEQFVAGLAARQNAPTGGTGV